MNLAGKAALVTGSTSGIGLGIAESLASEGCNVILNGFGDSSDIEGLRKRIEQQSSVQVHYFGADVSKVDECCEMVERARAQFGGLDILVNNAGIQHVAPIEHFPVDQWNAVIAINLSAAFHLTAAALPAMRVQRYGRIINIASVHGLVGSVHKSAYVAAKHGLIGLTKVVALETAGQGITCNAICPGWVLTPMVEAQLNRRVEEQGLERHVAEMQLLGEKQPSGVFSRAADIGALAVFLCSEAASNLTGAALPVDGAWTAQ